jgi:fructose-specific phosphotransferase system component IIB
MKVKLTVQDVEKFKLACEATDIRIEDQRQYGKTSVVQVSVKHVSQLYAAGLIQSSLDILSVENNNARVQGYEERTPAQVADELASEAKASKHGKTK